MQCQREDTFQLGLKLRSLVLTLIFQLGLKLRSLVQTLICSTSQDTI
jgi:hypothetical protein